MATKSGRRRNTMAIVGVGIVTVMVAVVTVLLVQRQADRNSPASLPSGTPGVTQVIEPAVLKAELVKKAPQLPTGAPCPAKGGKWRDLAEEVPQSAAVYVSPMQIAQANLDADPEFEVVASLICTEHGFGHPFDEFVAAFERGADGSYTAFPAVMVVQPETVLKVSARTGGGVVLAMQHDRLGDGSDDSELRSQNREFVWQDTGFRQVAGPTSMPALPKADVSLRTATGTRGAPNGATCPYTFSLSVTNKGPVTSAPILVGFWTPTTGWAAVVQEAHPAMPSGATAQITVTPDLPCNATTVRVMLATGGADPRFGDNEKEISFG